MFSYTLILCLLSLLVPCLPTQDKFLKAMTFINFNINEYIFNQKYQFRLSNITSIGFVYEKVIPLSLFIILQRFNPLNLPGDVNDNQTQVFL